MKTRVVPIADPHSGLKVGLMLPNFVEDENTPYEVTHKPNKTQKYLWKKLNAFRNVVFDNWPDEVIVFLMSDSVHGNKKGHEVWSTSMKAQKDNYVECMRLFTSHKLTSAVYAVRGSRFHIGENNGIVENQAARELGAYKHVTFDKLEVKIQGLRFMLQHKGPKPGSREWTKKNSMFHALKDRAMQAMRLGTEPLDVYVWAHHHEYIYDKYVADGPWGEKEICGFTLPAWCTPNEYAIENVKNLEYAHVGGIYYDIEDGRLTHHKFFDKFDAVERVTHGRK